MINALFIDIKSKIKHHTDKINYQGKKNISLYSRLLIDFDRRHLPHRCIHSHFSGRILRNSFNSMHFLNFHFSLGCQFNIDWYVCFWLQISVFYFTFLFFKKPSKSFIYALFSLLGENKTSWHSPQLSSKYEVIQKTFWVIRWQR